METKPEIKTEPKPKEEIKYDEEIEIKLQDEPFIPDLMNQLLQKGKYEDAYEYYCNYFIRTDTTNAVEYFYTYNEDDKIFYFEPRPLEKSLPLFNDIPIKLKNKITKISDNGQKEEKEESLKTIKATTYFRSKWPTYKIVERMDLDYFLFKKVSKKIYKGETYDITQYYYNQRPRIDQIYEKPYEQFDEESKKGVQMFWFIIKQIWASNNETHWYFLRNWFIDVINLKRTGSCIYNQARQGTGKSTITEFLIKVIGKRYATEDGIKIFGRFNGNLKNKIFVSCEELSHVSLNEWSTINGILKQMITNNYFSVEEKYVNAEMVRLYANFIINTNDKFLKTEEDDRRFFVSEMSNLTEEIVFEFGNLFDIDDLKNKSKYKDITELKIAFWTIIHKYLGVKGEDTVLRQNVRKCFYAYCVDEFKKFQINENDETYWNNLSSNPPKTEAFLNSIKRTDMEKFLIDNFLKKGLGIEEYVGLTKKTKYILLEEETNSNKQKKKKQTYYIAFEPYKRNDFLANFKRGYESKSDMHIEDLLKSELGINKSSPNDKNNPNYFIYQEKPFDRKTGHTTIKIHNIDFTFLYNNFTQNKKILTLEEKNEILTARIEIMDKFLENEENKKYFNEFFKDADKYDEYKKIIDDYKSKIKSPETEIIEDFEDEDDVIEENVDKVEETQVEVNQVEVKLNTFNDLVSKIDDTKKEEVIKQIQDDFITRQLKLNENSNANTNTVSNNVKPKLNLSDIGNYMINSNTDKYQKPFNMEDKNNEDLEKVKQEELEKENQTKEPTNIDLVFEGQTYNNVEVKYSSRLNAWGYKDPKKTGHRVLKPYDKQNITFAKNQTVLFDKKYKNYFVEQSNRISYLGNFENFEETDWYKENTAEDYVEQD